MSDLKTAALEYHALPRPGKLSVELTKATATARDLSLAYSPGVAEPVREIARDPELAYKYTGKGNLVAVISDGTAILGLGNLGPLASKPVMEGKGVLFKRFAGIDVFDIEVDSESPQAFIDTVKRISITFGGITLADAKIVCLGAGAAAISCMKLIVSMGAKLENIYMVDSKGVIQSERTDLNQYKAMFAHPSSKRTLAEALDGADVFVGLSGPNLLSAEGLKAMAANPIVFACSNPDPEIAPELAHATRDDVIMATGRSDYPNQVNNVLGFPFIFRGALDVRAKRINEEMKVAAANALRELAKLPVPQDVCDAYGGAKLEFGREYIIPKPMDKRLITLISDAVAKAAIETGVATLPYPKNYPLQSVDDVFNG